MAGTSGKQMSNKWQISRRTMLKGMGVVMGLPLLDAMKPLESIAATVADAAVNETPKRLAVLFFPNGVNENKWTPEGEGAGFKLSPILEPLAPHQKDILVF